MVINEPFNANQIVNHKSDESTDEKDDDNNEIPEEINFLLYFSVALALLGTFECFGKSAFLDVLIFLFN